MISGGGFGGRDGVLAGREGGFLVLFCASELVALTTNATAIIANSRVLNRMFRSVRKEDTFRAGFNAGTLPPAYVLTGLEFAPRDSDVKTRGARGFVPSKVRIWHTQTTLMGSTTAPNNEIIPRAGRALPSWKNHKLREDK